MEYKYLVSVIIPTRNRQYYANQVIHHIFNYKNDIQIIVQDNSDTQELCIMLKDILHSKRIVYNYIKERISAVDNYDGAIKYVLGEFICAIGDDDVVLKQIVNCAMWMKSNNIDAVRPCKKYIYTWPTKNISGKVTLGECKSTIKYINTKNGVIELLRQGGQGYLNLPIIGSYHGLIRTECMKKVYSYTGHYYGGCSPDMYSAVCLSLLDNFVTVDIDYPITMPGICEESTSADSANGRHIGELESAPHFIGMNRYSWDNRIPRVYSVETIWAETMLKAFSEMGYEKLTNQDFNEKSLIEQLYLNNIKYKNIVLKALNKEQIDMVIHINSMRKIKAKLKNAIKIYLKKIKSLFIHNRNEYMNIKSIGDAIAIVEEYLITNKYLSPWR